MGPLLIYRELFPHTPDRVCHMITLVVAGYMYVNIMWIV